MTTFIIDETKKNNLSTIYLKLRAHPPECTELPSIITTPA